MGLKLQGYLQLLFWVAVEELNLSDYVGEPMLITIYAHLGNPVLSCKIPGGGGALTVCGF